MMPSVLTCVGVRRHKSAWLLPNRRGFGTRAAVFVGPLLTVIALLALVPSWRPASVLAAGQQKNFQALGPMPGSCQGCDTYGSGLSADGSTVVGSAYVCPDGSTTCSSTSKTEAYRWTVANGYQILGDLNGSFGSSPSATGSAAYAASSDGSVVVGEAPAGSNSFGAFRWTAAQGMVALPLPMIFAYGVSANGGMVVGGQYFWNNGQEGTFGAFPGQQNETTALGVSADGQIAVGAAINGSNGGGPTFNAFRWTLAGGLQDIGVPGVNSDADGISDDGGVIVGEFQIQVNGPYHAFRWSASTGMVDLGTLGGPGSRALAANQDGSVIVGTSFTNQQTTSNHAFRWTATTGMQDLNKLTNAGSMVLTFATGVSSDGTVIAGHGLANQQGSKFPQTVPFRAVVPLP